MIEEKANKVIKSISEPTLKRLPVYLHFLQQVWKEGGIDISAPVIGKALNYDATQVVKDLAVTGIKGKPRVGYNTYELIQTIEEYLGFNKTNEAFLIGAGNLGSALLAFSELQSFGLKVIAAFDVDPGVIGTKKGGVNVFHLNRMQELAERLKVVVGIITTPAEVAQETADRIVESGINAIWNFTPVYLQLPEHVIVQNTSMYSNVAVLLKKVNDAKQ